MGRRRRQSVELRKMLLPLEDQFGCRKRIGEQRRLVADAIGIKGRKHHHRGDRAPDAELHDRLDTKRFTLIPGHRIRRKCEHGGADQRKDDQDQRMAQRLRRKRDDHRDADQRRERIGKPAGDVKQRRHLQQVEAEQRQSRFRPEPVGRRKPGRQREIGDRKCADQNARLLQRQRKPQQQPDDDHSDRLAGDRKPAQPYQRLKPDSSA